MKRKLELADIAMYLPYKLRAEIPDYDDYLYYVSEELEIPDKEVSPNSFEVSRVDMSGYVYFSDEYTEESHIETIKPILRPMTDLTKPMTHPDINGGEEFVPLLWVLKDMKPTSDLAYDPQLQKVREYKMVKTYGKESRRCVNTHSIGSIIQSHREIKSLVKLHFDYQNLISKGLAVKFND